MFFSALFVRQGSRIRRFCDSFVSFSFCVALAFLAPASAFSASDNSQANIPQAARVHTEAGATTAPAELRIAYIPNKGTLNATYNSNRYLKELFHILAPYLQHTARFVPVGSNEQATIDQSKRNEVNIIALLAPSALRSQYLIFSENAIAGTELFLVTDADKHIYHEDKNALQDKSVAIYAPNTTAKNALSAYLFERNIQMRYILYDSHEAYLSSHAQFHLVNSFYFPEGKQIVASIGTQALHFAATPNNMYFLSVLDKALEQAQVHDADKLRALYETHMQKHTLALGHEVTLKESEYLRKTTRETHVGYFAEHYPIQYTGKDKKLAGITAGVLEIFRQMRGHPSTYTPYTPHQGIDIKDFDMVLSIVGDRETKEKYFNASQTYATLPMVLFRHTDSSQRTLGMLDYSVFPDEYVQKTFPHWRLSLFSDFKEMLDAYKARRIGAILLSNVEAEYLISRLGVAGHKISATSLVLPLQFYLSKAFPPEAMSILNAYIDKLSPDAVQQIIVAAGVAIRAPVTVQEFVTEHWIPISLLLGTLLFFGSAIYADKANREKKMLHDIINKDKLTGLCSNARAFEVITTTLKRAKSGQYMIFCIDIDNFSLLNQVYGREKAEQVLIFLGRMFEKKYIHDQGADCVARLGGDLFLVFTKTRPMNSTYDPPEFHTKIIEGVRDILQNTYTICLSRGSYIIEDPALPVETMLYYCNAARRQGKQAYGMSSACFTAAMANEINAQQEVISKMEAALLNEEFTLIFQPKVNLQSMRICGAEVLVRWLPPNASPIYPDAFIPVFESNAFIARLDMYVFEKACDFIQRNRHTAGFVPLAINLSGMTMLHSETYDSIVAAMQKYDVSAREIEIELTESALVNESSAFLESISAFARLGFKIAIDDFGTGVSSLHRLSAMPVDVVKLDKSFLDTKLPKKRGSLLVESIITMLHRLGIKVVAEGVETDAQVAILQNMQCDIVQGYYFYKPQYEKAFINSLISAAEQGQRRNETFAA